MIRQPVATHVSTVRPLFPIVGLLLPDFYQLYLEQAIEEGLFRLRAAPR